MTDATMGSQPGQPVMPAGGTPLTPGSPAPTMAPPGTVGPSATPTPAAGGSPPPSPAPPALPQAPGQPSGPPASPPAPAAASTPPAATPSPQPAPQPAPQPEPWPEKFLREGKPDPEALLKSYRELERAQFKRRDDLKVEIRKEMDAAATEGVPAAPADYKYEPVQLKDGRKLEVDTQSPLFQFFATAAHELKIPQSKFQELLGQYAMANLASLPSWEVESAKLGEHAEQRLGRAGAWGRGNLSQKAYDAYARIPATAENIALFEEIMELAGEPKFAISQAGTVKENLTMDDIKTMMADPRYWHDAKREPAFVQRVKAGLRKLAATAR